MKTARTSFLSTPEFKMTLEQQAAERNISVGELIRQRFSDEVTAEEKELIDLTAQLRTQNEEASKVLQATLTDAQEFLTEMRNRRSAERHNQAVAG